MKISEIHENALQNSKKQPKLKHQHFCKQLQNHQILKHQKHKAKPKTKKQTK